MAVDVEFKALGLDEIEEQVDRLVQRAEYLQSVLENIVKLSEGCDRALRHERRMMPDGSYHYISEDGGRIWRIVGSAVDEENNGI